MARPRNAAAATPKRSAGPVTLDMVARDAGVSASTVSRVLNGTAVVSEDKREAIESAIDRLGFVPNPIARGLAGGRTLSVGVLTQSIDSPFYGAALRGVEDELDKAGYSPLFASGHWNAVEEARCIETLRSRRVDGIIVLDGRLSNAALRTCARTLPTVVSGRVLSASNLFSLSFDNFTGARLATEHLLALGHRRIAFIAGDPAHPDALERERGYRAALEATGVAYTADLVAPGLFNEEGGLAAAQRLIDGRQRFTAIFAANDQMAIGACLALHRHALRVPQDVSVVGFDDLLASRHALPPLTTVHQPAYELGQIAAASLLCMLRGDKPDAVLPAPRLIVRESTRAPAGSA